MLIEQIIKIFSNISPISIFFETETKTSLLIRTLSTRDLYEESNKEEKEREKGETIGSGGAPGHLN